MNNDAHTAFDSLERRAAAMAGSQPLDRISLREHVIEVEIGAFQTERGYRQRVCFNIVVEVHPQGSPLGDDVDRILSYDTISQAIQIELAAERLNLLETLAARIAKRVLQEPQAERIFIRIEKLDRGPGELGVEIVRSRPARRPVGAVGGEGPDHTPHPLVVFLSNAAIVSPKLSEWLDTLRKTGLPVVLCVGQSDAVGPQALAPAAQVRIDLLAIEQNAWVLAGLDRRCVVTGTRTELDWAARNGQMSVWAPSKMVLDAVDGPKAQQNDAPSLVQWFAREISAARVISIGAAFPTSGDLAIENFSLAGPLIL